MVVYDLSKALPVSRSHGTFVIVCRKACKENITTGSNLEKHIKCLSLWEINVLRQNHSEVVVMAGG